MAEQLKSLYRNLLFRGIIRYEVTRVIREPEGTVVIKLVNAFLRSSRIIKLVPK